MNYYEHHLGDYAKKTSDLSTTEHGAYRLLLDTYYATEKPLPSDYKDLYRIARAMTPAERQAVRKVADKHFPIGSDGLRHNKRGDLEIAKARKRIGLAIENGRKGGRPKGKNRDDDESGGNPAGIPPGIPAGYENETQRVSQQEPSGVPSGKALHVPQELPTTELLREEVTFTAPPLPKNLSSETWAMWKAHLRSKGKGMTPQTEGLQLVRLGEHQDPNRVVLDAIANGSVYLTPYGGAIGKTKQQTASERRDAASADMHRNIIGQGNGPEDTDPRDITGQSERVAD